MDTVALFFFVHNELDWHTVLMNGGEGSGSGSGSGWGSGSGGNNLPGGGDNGGNNPGGPNPNDGWTPHNYQYQRKQNGSHYTSRYIDPSTVLSTYNPAEDNPPQSDRELSVLLDYRFSTRVRDLGYENWNVQNAFPSDSITDKIAKARLFNHIYDHRADLPIAYRQMDARSQDVTPWDRVEISSFLINSLNRSDKK